MSPKPSALKSPPALTAQPVWLPLGPRIVAPGTAPVVPEAAPTLARLM